MKATGFLEVENATLQHNPEEVIYSGDFAERGYLTGPPILALAGLILGIVGFIASAAWAIFSIAIAAHTTNNTITP